MKVPQLLLLHHYPMSKEILTIRNPSQNNTKVTLGKRENTPGKTVGFTITQNSTSEIQSLSNRTITVNGINANEEIYIYNSTQGTVKNLMVLFEKDNTLYYIHCSSLEKDFDQQKNNFELIINSLKI